jgi:hypothetical protein
MTEKQWILALPGLMTNKSAGIGSRNIDIVIEEGDKLGPARKERVKVRDKLLIWLMEGAAFLGKEALDRALSKDGDPGGVADRSVPGRRGRIINKVPVNYFSHESYWAAVLSDLILRRKEHAAIRAKTTLSAQARGIHGSGDGMIVENAVDFDSFDAHIGAIMRAAMLLGAIKAMEEVFPPEKSNSILDFDSPMEMLKIMWTKSPYVKGPSGFGSVEGYANVQQVLSGEYFTMILDTIVNLAFQSVNRRNYVALFETLSQVDFTEELVLSNGDDNTHFFRMSEILVNKLRNSEKREDILKEAYRKMTETVDSTARRNGLAVNSTKGRFGRWRHEFLSKGAHTGS